MAAGIVRVSVNTEDMQRVVPILKSRARPAIARAINRTSDSAKTAWVRAVAQDVGLKVSAVRDQFVVQKATADRLTATFRASAKRVPLIDFNARGPEPSRGRGKGVTAKLPGGAGRYPNAFIATVGSGRHKGVFIRKGEASARKSVGAWSKNLPIIELRGPSIWQSAVKTQQVAIDRAQEQLPKNIAHEFEFALSRA